MNLLTSLGLDALPHPVICLAGAGGKTTLLYKLAAAYAARGAKIAAFTTTHILRPEQSEHLALIIDDNTCVAQAGFANGKLVLAGTLAKDGKLLAPQHEMMHFLMNTADVILAEADGSRCLPVKFPSADEPCLLDETNRLFVVAGLSALGHPLCEVCHRWPLAMAACGFVGQQTPLDTTMLAQILYKGYGALSPLFVLNQADNEALAALGGEVKAALTALGATECIVLSLEQEKLWQ